MTTVERQLLLLGQFQVDCILIGGVAAQVHGSSYVTNDLDICYARDPANLERLAVALKTLNARLRGAPPEVPFVLDASTLRNGLNFTFVTDAGDLDLLGEVSGVGVYADALQSAVVHELFGYRFAVLSLEKLITSKRAAGRAKDLLVLPELEAILEYHQTADLDDARPEPDKWK